MFPAPAVRCAQCAYHWNSAAMAEGLRALGSCPKCDGPLEFREGGLEGAAQDRAPAARRTEPHLVLGIPRR